MYSYAILQTAKANGNFSSTSRCYNMHIVSVKKANYKHTYKTQKRTKNAIEILIKLMSVSQTSSKYISSQFDAFLSLARGQNKQQLPLNHCLFFCALLYHCLHCVCIDFIVRLHFKESRILRFTMNEFGFSTLCNFSK